MACQQALPFLDDEGRRFYVPAKMRLVLGTVPDAGEGWPGPESGWLWGDLPWLFLPPEVFDAPQRQAVRRFFRVMGFRGKGFEAWAR